MSGDDELEGEDEESFREHFVPIGRSLKRTITSRSIQMYTVSFVGIIVLSASIGPAIIGGYATFQEDFGLCGNPTLDVRSAADTEELTAGGELPNIQRLGYEELTPDEQRGFRTALTVPNHEEEIAGNIEHLTTFRNGAIVTYRGKEHYVLVSSLDECVPFGEFPFPVSVAGVIVGAGLSIAPILWRRSR